MGGGNPPADQGDRPAIFHTLNTAGGASFDKGENHTMRAISVTTTPTIQGTQIVNYLGIVRAVVAPGVGPINDWKAGVADTVGWRASSVENLLLDALHEAEQELVEKAIRAGANAIVGASHILADYDRGEKRALQFVMMSGTAVVIEPAE